MEPSFKFKYQDAGTHPMSGQKLYSGTMIVEMPDGKISTYKAGQHNSQQKLKDDFNRMIAGVNASLRGENLSANQNYGSQSVEFSPSDITLPETPGGIFSAPDTFTVRDKSTGQQQVVNQQGIRQGDPFYGFVNVQDPNYDSTLDAIVDPVTGIPVPFQPQYRTTQPINQTQNNEALNNQNNLSLNAIRPVTMNNYEEINSISPLEYDPLFPGKY